MRDSKFLFQPLVAKKKIVTESFVTILKSGQLFFNYWTLRNLGLSEKDKTFVQLYCDLEKRAIGFKFKDELEQRENVRLVKIDTTKAGSKLARISIKAFLQSLPDVHLPLKELKVAEYHDLLMGDLYYITVPYGRRKND